MVHLELGQSNATVLGVAAHLAERFGAGVIGISAAQPMQVDYSAGYPCEPLIEQDRAQKAHEAQRAEAEFRAALQGRVAWLDWRAAVVTGSLSGYLAEEARCADLVLTGVTSGAVLDASRRTAVSGLVMELGRPMLLVPPGLQGLGLQRIVIRWRETRESRRAAVDALPLLRQAAYVGVAEIVGEQELPAARLRLADVAAWLRRHGITAETLPRSAYCDGAAGLGGIAAEQGADMVVAGAYGHSRLREWALGGVTRNLLLHPDRCMFLSH